jgi:2,3-diphosphopglycerate-independent phosphoglycerate mutase
LGYDISKVFEGRGSLEAASMQVPIERDEVAMRCNVICLDGDIIKNHSAGNISTQEADELIKTLNEQLPSFTLDSGRVVEPSDIRFFTGLSYRHLLKIKGGNKHVSCTPPHDRIGKPWRPELPKNEYDVFRLNEPITKLSPKETADLLRKLILWSQGILSNHPINLKRIAEGKDPANSIWPWSLGYRPQMQTLMSLFPERVRTGAVISAVDLIFGIGVYCGLDKVTVPGSTGLWDTNYEGKADAAITISDDGTATIVFQDENTIRNTLRYNPSNNPPIFSCYAENNSQKDVKIYRKKAVVEGIPGDANNDGIVNVTDVMLVVRYSGGMEVLDINLKNADINGDGQVNITDAMSIIPLAVN